MIPAIGGLGQIAAGQIGGATQSGSLAQLEGLGQSGAPGQSEATLAGPAGTGPGGGFSGALNNAISSLEQTQRSADSASQALATGTAGDPETAVLTVQDAQLEMQLAAQLRNKATEAVQTIFQTQV